MKYTSSHCSMMNFMLIFLPFMNSTKLLTCSHQKLEGLGAGLLKEPTNSEAQDTAPFRMLPLMMASSRWFPFA